jgi:hypothetical protein
MDGECIFFGRFSNRVSSQRFLQGAVPPARCRRRRAQPQRRGSMALLV